MSSDNDTDSTEELDDESDSEHDCDLDMHREDDVDAPYCVDLDGDVDMESNSDHEVEEDKEEEDVEEEEEEEEDKDEDEDEDEDDGKEPWTIVQGAMVNTSADDVDTIVDDKPILLPEQGQAMHEYIAWPQPPVADPRPQTLGPHPWPQSQKTHPLSERQFLVIVTPQNITQLCQLYETLREPETPRISMWISSYSANRLVSIVSLITLSLRHTRIAR